MQSTHESDSPMANPPNRSGEAGPEDSAPLHQARVLGRVPETSLDHALRSLRPWLDDPELTELCMYRPMEAFIERGRAWTCVPMPFASFEWCVRLAKLVGNATRQRIDEGSPLLSAGLPTGERVQFAIPPAAAPGHVAIAIRRPSQIAYSITQLVARGIFLRTSCGSGGRRSEDEELAKRLEARDFGAFMHLAVRYRKNILVSGPTGSGKTTWTKADPGDSKHRAADHDRGCGGALP